MAFMVFVVQSVFNISDYQARYSTVSSFKFNATVVTNTLQPYM